MGPCYRKVSKYTIIFSLLLFFIGHLILRNLPPASPKGFKVSHNSRSLRWDFNELSDEVMGMKKWIKVGVICIQLSFSI